MIDVKGGAHGSQKSKKDGHSWKNEISIADFILHTKTMQIATAARNLHSTWCEPSQTFLSLRMLLIDVKGGAHAIETQSALTHRSMDDSIVSLSFNSLRSTGGARDGKREQRKKKPFNGGSRTDLTLLFSLFTSYLTSAKEVVGAHLS